MTITVLFFCCYCCCVARSVYETKKVDKRETGTISKDSDRLVGKRKASDFFVIINGRENGFLFCCCCFVGTLQKGQFIHIFPLPRPPFFFVGVCLEEGLLFVFLFFFFIAPPKPLKKKYRFFATYMERRGPPYLLVTVRSTVSCDAPATRTSDGSPSAPDNG